MTSEDKKEKDILEITKGENANLDGMEPPKIEVVEVCPANAPDKHSVRINDKEIVAFDSGHSAHSVAGNLRMALAQFFRSPAPTPPQILKHKDGCTWLTELPTGVGTWGCSCGLDKLLLELEDYELTAPTPPLVDNNPAVCSMRAAALAFGGDEDLEKAVTEGRMNMQGEWPTPPLDVEAEKRIAEIRERESKATKGPLVAGLDLPFVDNNDPDKRMVWSNSLMVADFRSVWIKQEQSEADAEFYAHSRQDIPFLLEQISLLRRHIPSPAPQLKLKIQELVGLPVDREIEDDLVFSAVKALHHAVGLCQHSHWAASPAQPEKRDEWVSVKNPPEECGLYEVIIAHAGVEDYRDGATFDNRREPEWLFASDPYCTMMDLQVSRWRKFGPLPAPPQSGKEGQ